MKTLLLESGSLQKILLGLSHLLVADCLDSEQFLIRENDLVRVCTCLQLVKKSLHSIQSLFFWRSVRR